jgi:photosystem II stability/assembly factor-like uncharacterized protein
VSDSNLFAGTMGGVYLSKDKGHTWYPANSGIRSSFVFGLAVKDNKIFAACWDQGIFLSTDNGSTWSKKGLDEKASNCFAVTGTHLFAGTNEGVFLSTNDGNNWISSGINDRFVSCFTVMGSNLFAGANDGVYLSADSGKSWKSISSGLPVNLYTTILSLVNNESNIFAGTGGNGVYVSTDSGLNWTQTGLTEASVRSLVIKDGYLFAGTGQGVYRSSDNGLSWTQINTGSLGLLSNPTIDCFAVIGTKLFAGTNNVFGQPDGVYLSSNNGESWEEANTGLTNLGISDLVVNGTKLYITTYRSIYLSTDNGISWTDIKYGLPLFSINFFVNCLTINNKKIFIGVSDGVWSAEEDLFNWQKIGLGNVFVNCLAFSGENLIAGTQQGIFLTTDQGLNWNKVYDTGIEYENIRDIIVIDSNVFAGSSLGILCSTDNGETWTRMQNNLSNEVIGSIVINGGYIFVGTSRGIFRSIDNGENWIAASNGLPREQDGHIYVRDLTISGQNLFAGTSKGIFLSTDQGTNWYLISQDYADLFVTCLIANDNYVFVGTDRTGIWKRDLSEIIVPVELISFTATANGKEVTLNWSTETELNNQGFEIQRKFGSNDFVTVGLVKGNGTTTSPNNYTYIDKLFDAGKYFYRLKQIDFGGKYEYSQEVEVNWSPFTSYKLEQNYPNPFNPTTTIGFGIPEKGNVRLSILNIIGEEVRVLLNETKESGYHSIDFHASELPSGVYFYKLKAGRHVETKKMILLR